MILYIGKENNGFFVKEVAKNYNHEVRYTGEVIDIEQIMEESLKEKTDYIIVDIGALIIGAEEIAEIFSRIKETRPDSRIIVFFQGGNEKSDITTAFKKIGVNDFLFSIEIGSLKSELEKILDSSDLVLGKKVNEKKTEDTNDIIEEEKIVKEKITIKPEKKTSVKTIAVAGSISRIGTTTQALQMVKYLQSCGKKPCYIECNDTGYLSEIKNFYQDVIFARKDCITYSNVDMIPCENASKVRGEYDCCIYDYGLAEKMPTALLSAFLEKDKKIIVGGVSPIELRALELMVHKFDDNDVDYIFSFVPEDDKEEVRLMMGNKKDKIHFAEYTPDPFFFSSKSTPMYRHLLEENPQKNTEDSVKKGFFGKWKRGDK